MTAPLPLGQLILALQEQDLWVRALLDKVPSTLNSRKNLLQHMPAHHTGVVWKEFIKLRDTMVEGHILWNSPLGYKPLARTIPLVHRAPPLFQLLHKTLSEHTTAGVRVNLREHGDASENETDRQVPLAALVRQSCLVEEAPCLRLNLGVGDAQLVGGGIQREW